MSALNPYALLEQFLLRLAEDFDSVFIAVSKNEEGVTSASTKRAGNYYATKGLVQDWLDDEKNKELALSIKDKED